MANIQNVVIYIDDAVRYDIAQKYFDSKVIKTISSSVHTPVSFASIFTGDHPPSHNIHSFRDRLPKSTYTIFDINRGNVAMSNKGVSAEPLRDIFPTSTTDKINDMEEPFVYIIWAPGGHAPYGGHDFPTYEFSDLNASEYLNKHAGETKKLREDYDKGVQESIQEFNRIRASFQERGLKDRTLFIYTSDHGELLGEYGLLDHNLVLTPELVYVPTVLDHPKIAADSLPDLIHHTDILPTVLDTVNASELEERRFVGSSIFNQPMDREQLGYVHFERELYGESKLLDVERKVRSVWDADGGHVFTKTSYIDALKLYVGLLAKSPKGQQIRSSRKYLQAAQLLQPGYQRMGSPSFTREEAEEVISQIEKRDRTANKQDIDRERLKDLGYL